MSDATPSDDDETALDRETLSAFVTPAPSPDLADRIVARLQRRPERRAYRRWLVGASLVATAGALWFLSRPSSTLAGSWARAEQETIALGDRATAVAYGGARLSWTVSAGGDTRVSQTEGSVFYRVERGGAFVVATPAGEVRVTGTCFRVEVTNMKPSKHMLGGAAAGAALATAVLVTVYEGGVILANDHGRQAASAGQRATMNDSSRPQLAEPASEPARAGEGAAAAAPEVGRGTLAAKDTTIRELQTRVAQLENSLTRAQDQLAEAGRATGQVMRVDPTPEDLQAWAKSCEIHVDAPSAFGAGPDVLDDEDIKRIGLLPEEVPAMNELLAEAHRQALPRFLEIYAQATGDREGGEHLAPGAMFSEIMDKSSPQIMAEARRRMALERAGLAQPPADLSKLPPGEQALRLITQLGNDFEAGVAQRLGVKRARELRKVHNGWPGLRMDMDGCPK